MSNATEQIFLPSPSGTQGQPDLPKPGNGSQPVNLDSVEEFSKVCRVCAAISELVMPIFSGEGLQNNLADKIHRHLPIKVSVSDSPALPVVVCYQCAGTLLAAHELAQCAAQADVALRTRSAALARAANLTDEDDLQGTKELETAEEIAQGTCIANTQNEISEPRAQATRRRRHCALCGLGFSDAGNLARHARAAHAQLRPHACDRCPAAFSRKDHLRDHERTHLKAREFVCAVCGCAARSAAGLRSHAARHAPARWACPAPPCRATFRRRGELRAHVSVHTGERAHACACGKTFRLRAQLTRHARTHRRRRCAFCPERVPRGRYRAHLERRHAALVFHCAECDRYLSRRVLLLHMTAHAAHYDARAPAAPATAALTLAAALQTLLARAEPAPPRPAPDPVVLSAVTVQTPATASAPAAVTASLPETAIAPAAVRDEFSDRSDAESDFGPLPDSVFSAIEDPPDAVPPPADPPVARGGRAAAGKTDRGRERACPHCGKKYSVASSYFYHLKHAHRRSREHACAVCGATFGTSGTLREHERLHSGERPLACARCGKHFRSKAGLYIHAQTHGGGKPWQCGECGRAFRWRAALRRHAARHSARRGGARAHRCPQRGCARAFAVRADLLRHMRTHTPRARLACPAPACDATFAQPRYLRAHLAKKHPTAAPAPAPTEIADDKLN